MSKQGSILDPVQNELSPYIYNNPESAEPPLKPILREWILAKIYSQIKQFRPNPKDWLEVYLAGSLCSYQFTYSEETDCDVHLYYPKEMLSDQDRAKLIAIFMDKIEGQKLPGTPYPIQVYLSTPSIKPEMEFKPGLRAGYDIKNDYWLVPPDKELAHDVEAEQKNLFLNALEMAHKMESLIKYEPQKAIEYEKQLRRKRNQAWEQGKGVFSLGEVVYKMLKAKGLFNQLDQIRSAT